MSRPQAEPPDLREHGRGVASDRRLFFQLLVFDGCPDPAALGGAVENSRGHGVAYAELNQPRGAGLLTCSEDPAYFTDALRSALAKPTFSDLTPRAGWSMIGRTYSIGYETDLDETLLHRPVRHAFEEAWPWAVWYPLRRSGAFARLDAEEQKGVLAEHGKLGMSFSAGDFAHDVRLACHGLDPSDNDFTIGLMGAGLAPLSKLVEAMRRTVQTSTYLERLGPFFVGRRVWQSSPPVLQ